MGLQAALTHESGSPTRPFALLTGEFHRRISADPRRRQHRRQNEISANVSLAQPSLIFYVLCVPVPVRDHVTTEDLLAVTRSSRDTLYEWVARRLLPRPRIATGADGQQLAAWAPEALERVRFIVANQRRGLAMEDIAPLVEARWPRR